MSLQIYHKLKEKYRGKKILVVGLGVLGGSLGVAQFFCELGAYVTVTDKKKEEDLLSSINKLKGFKNINFHLGGHFLEDFLKADLIFKGPSVPWDLPEIVEAYKKGIPIEMEMAFVAKYFPGKIIGITGTRGKSTTTAMIYSLLKEFKDEVFLGGGLPGISTIEYLKKASENSWLVAELSSWSLSGFHRSKISPHIAVFTSFYPDHLNYYQNLEDYFYDKAAIFLYQKKDDFLIANERLKSKIEKYPSLGKKIYFKKNDFPQKLNFLIGDHNLENAAACLKVAKILNLSEEKAVKIIKNFSGLPFRLQKVKEKNGVLFINDTTSTTPVATEKAIDAFSQKKIILILGGNSKNLPFDALVKKLEKVEKIILLNGSFTKEIIPILNQKYKNKCVGPFDNLKEAVEEAYKSGLSFKEAVVLFSPGATSFSMFKNEFHRGEEFNKIVSKL